MRPLIAALLLTAPALAGAQVGTIPNTVTNPTGTAYGTSTAIPRVGESVDEATRATGAEQDRDVRVPGPTSRRERREAERARAKQQREEATTATADDEPR